MGAWGEELTANDEAQEWLANSIERPIVEAITDALNRASGQMSDDVSKAEVQAAVALLLDLTDHRAAFRHSRFSIDCAAKEEGLWDKAIAAIRALLSDQQWLTAWSRPETKVVVLREILAELSAARSRMENGDA